MTKVRWVLSSGLSSKFHSLFSSEKIWKSVTIRQCYRQLKVGTFLRHSVYRKNRCMREMQLNCTRMFIITARRSYASAVLGVVILSVCPSVCHTRALLLCG